jgi:hypothetical protein
MEKGTNVKRILTAENAEHAAQGISPVSAISAVNKLINKEKAGLFPHLPIQGTITLGE